MGIRSIKSLLRATPRLGRCDRRERRVRTAGVGVVASSTSSYSEICGKSDCNLQFWFLKRCRVKLYLFKATTDCSAFRQSKCWYWLEFPCEGMVYAEPVGWNCPFVTRTCLWSRRQGGARLQFGTRFAFRW